MILLFRKPIFSLHNLGEKTTPKVENIVEAEPKGLEQNEPILQEVEQEEEEAPVDDVDSEKQVNKLQRVG